jgi:hypothetical protein
MRGAFENFLLVHHKGKALERGEGLISDCVSARLGCAASLSFKF